MEQYQSLLLAILILSGLLAGGRWALAKESRSSMYSLGATCGALALAAGIAGLPSVVAAWGVTLILGGGLLSFIRLRPSLRWPLLLFGVFCLSGLAFSPTQATIALYSAPANMIQYTFLLVQGLLLAGWVRKVLEDATVPLQLQRWELIIYASGLVLMALVYLGLGSIIQPGNAVSAITFILSLAIPGLAAFFAVGRRRWGVAVSRTGALLEPVLSLDWLYRLGGAFLGLVGRLLRLFSGLLEGQAGVLWALLLVALLLSLIAQLSVAG